MWCGNYNNITAAPEHQEKIMSLVMLKGGKVIVEMLFTVNELRSVSSICKRIIESPQIHEIDSSIVEESLIQSWAIGNSKTMFTPEQLLSLFNIHRRVKFEIFDLSEEAEAVFNTLDLLSVRAMLLLAEKNASAIPPQGQGKVKTCKLGDIAKGSELKEIQAIVITERYVDTGNLDMKKVLILNTEDWKSTLGYLPKRNTVISFDGKRYLVECITDDEEYIELVLTPYRGH